MSIEKMILRSCADGEEVFFYTINRHDLPLGIYDFNGKNLSNLFDITDKEYLTSYVVYDRVVYDTGAEAGDLYCTLLNEGSRERKREMFRGLDFEVTLETALPHILVDVGKLYEGGGTELMELFQKYGIPGLEVVNVAGAVMVGSSLSSIIERISSLLALLHYIDEGEQARRLVLEMRADVQIELISENGALSKKLVCRDWLSAAEYFAIEYVAQNFDANIETKLEHRCRRCGTELKGRQKLYCSSTCKNASKMQRYRSRKKASCVCAICGRSLEDGDSACRLGGQIYCENCVYNSRVKMWGDELEEL